MKRLALLGGFLFLTQAPLFGQTSLTGYWRFSVPNGGTSYLELKQDGETVTTVGRGFMRSSLTGIFHQGKLHLEGKSGRPGSTSTLVYDAAAVKGDKFTVRGTNPNGEIADGSFERVSRDEMYPERLPLPVLRQLPDTGLVRSPPMGWNSWNH